ncbi:hypothetical protein K0C01_04400 [Salinarchaeum sp. IM2453]|uniref:DUF7118 family protein n=1 Tax=Salinarchaeum sp. IM2453 TaxID=2862870 RepID=UPI001C82A48F|nr:hypothetical protein [Salinarchaeum sp. IM2453]QZA89386.1 hypothetical protein K0C01_04400 [Salinarchaeum sp. IM2453]
MSETPESALAELEQAVTEYIEATQAVNEYGEEQLRTVEERYETVRKLLLKYRDEATDTGIREYVSYAEFKTKFESFVSNLDDDFPRRQAFERAFDTIDKRRLSENDFEQAHEHLKPVKQLAARLEQRETTRNKLIEARNRVEGQITETQEEISRLEQKIELGEADFDAPIEQLKGPIEIYNSAVTEAFTEIRRNQPVEKLLRVVERTRYYPLVPFKLPPKDLRSYLRKPEIRELSVSKLLEYADYSNSKLSHYVTDPREFKRHIATNRTYLKGLNADPALLDWPPDEADKLAFRVRELRSALGSLLSEEAIAALREIKEMTANRSEYDRIRNAAKATFELDEEDRRQLKDGTIQQELQRQRDLLQDLKAELESAPDPSN